MHDLSWMHTYTRIHVHRTSHQRGIGGGGLGIVASGNMLKLGGLAACFPRKFLKFTTSETTFMNKKEKKLNITILVGKFQGGIPCVPHPLNKSLYVHVQCKMYVLYRALVLFIIHVVHRAQLRFDDI